MCSEGAWTHYKPGTAQGLPEHAGKGGGKAEGKTHNFMLLRNQVHMTSRDIGLNLNAGATSFIPGLLPAQMQQQRKWPQPVMQQQAQTQPAQEFLGAAGPLSPTNARWGEGTYPWLETAQTQQIASAQAYHLRFEPESMEW